VKKEIEETLAKPEIQTDTASSESLKVEVRVHEQGAELQASAREVAVVTTAQGWMVRLLVLAAVLAIAAVYVGAHIGDGWVPADDGTLAQSALRVMQGQLPHRDFTELYTGGLSMIHAAAFRVFGVSLMSLRLCAFFFFLAWIPAVYFIALRFASTLTAGLITLVAVAWSYPNYPAAMPSWYNLFLATFGAAALLRYLEVHKARWLYLAGVCGGVSILIKVIGAYYIAGALLFLAFLEQSAVSGDSLSDRDAAGTEASAVPYRVFSAAALLLFLATVVYVFHTRLGVAEFYHFVLPATVLVALILTGESNVRGAATGVRFRGLLRLIIPFVCGVLTPIIAFLVPYARSGTIGQVFSGVTSSAIARSSELGVLSPVSVEKCIFALVLAALIAAAMYLHEFQGKIVGAAVGTALTVMLVKSTTSSGIVSGVWYSVATLTPVVVLFGAVAVLRSRKSGALTQLQQQRMMVLISLAALCGLVQYPFAAPIYLCYALPLTFLAAVAVVATAKQQPGTYVLAAVAGFYLLFGVVMLVPDYVYELTHKVGPMDELHLERAGGLRIEYAANYADLIHVLQQHSPNGLMYAANACAELYFLAGLKNVTRDDGGAQPEVALKALQSGDLKLVVINEAPFFPSSRMNPDVRAEVMRKFPESREVGYFRVFWRQ